MAQRQRPQGPINSTTGRSHGAQPALTLQQIERQGWLTTAEAYRGLYQPPKPAGSSSTSATPSGPPPSAPSSAPPPAASSGHSSASNQPLNVRWAPVRTPLSPPRPSKSYRVRPKVHSVSDSHGLKYIYAGISPRQGRNVLQRVEDISADPIIQSFSACNIKCACGTNVSDHSKDFNDKHWLYHAARCSVAREWDDPASRYYLTAKTQEELTRLRRASTDQALAYLEDKKLIQRV